MDLWAAKRVCSNYGSGHGHQLSSLRGAGEKLSGGGKSSGSDGASSRFGDRAAGASSNRRHTRRAAKMVIVDADTPISRTHQTGKVHRRTKVASMRRRPRCIEPRAEQVFAAIKAGWDNKRCLWTPRKTNRLKQASAARQKKCAMPRNIRQARY